MSTTSIAIGSTVRCGIRLLTSVLVAGATITLPTTTSAEDEAERARETYHATAAGAARTAREAGARRLLLTHVSARYADDARPLEAEAAMPTAMRIACGDKRSKRPAAAAAAIEPKVEVECQPFL